MILRLIREPSRDGATLGVLFVDGVFECWTLEDLIRETPAPVATWKVPGQTAIPAGRYAVEVTHSPRFGRRLPLLVDVPGFTGIRIHAGNRAADSEGCILVGRTRGAALVGDSRAAFGPLLQKLERARTAGADVTITIENPPLEGRAAA